jgi:hypothetical protein
VSHNALKIRRREGDDMTTITIAVPDELADSIARIGDRLPALLAQSLRQPTLPAHVYRYMVDFLASQPTVEQIAAFAPTSLS